MTAEGRRAKTEKRETNRGVERNNKQSKAKYAINAGRADLPSFVVLKREPAGQR